MVSHCLSSKQMLTRTPSLRPRSSAPRSAATTRLTILARVDLIVVRMRSTTWLAKTRHRMSWSQELLILPTYSPTRLCPITWSNYQPLVAAYLQTTWPRTSTSKTCHLKWRLRARKWLRVVAKANSVNSPQAEVSQGYALAVEQARKALVSSAVVLCSSMALLVWTVRRSRLHAPLRHRKQRLRKYPWCRWSLGPLSDPMNGNNTISRAVSRSAPQPSNMRLWRKLPPSNRCVKESVPKFQAQIQATTL